MFNPATATPQELAYLKRRLAEERGLTLVVAEWHGTCPAFPGGSSGFGSAGGALRPKAPPSDDPSWAPLAPEIEDK
jgi:hypothetical protein